MEDDSEGNYKEILDKAVNQNQFKPLCDACLGQDVVSYNLRFGTANFDQSLTLFPPAGQCLREEYRAQN